MNVQAIVVFLEVAFMVMLTTRVSVIQDGQEKIAIIVRQLQEFLIPFNGASYTGTTDLKQKTGSSFYCLESEAKES